MFFSIGLFNQPCFKWQAAYEVCHLVHKKLLSPIEALSISSFFPLWNNTTDETDCTIKANAQEGHRAPLMPTSGACALMVCDNTLFGINLYITTSTFWNGAALWACDGHGCCDMVPLKTLCLIGIAVTQSTERAVHLASTIMLIIIVMVLRLKVHVGLNHV